MATVKKIKEEVKDIIVEEKEEIQKDPNEHDYSFEDRIKRMKKLRIYESAAEAASIFAYLMVAKALNPKKLSSTFAELKSGFESTSDRAITLLGFKLSDPEKVDINSDEDELFDEDVVIESAPTTAAAETETDVIEPTEGD
jgi:hypothetical protein